MKRTGMLLLLAIVCLAALPASGGVLDEVGSGATTLLSLLARLGDVCKTTVMQPKRVYVASKLDQLHQQLWKLEVEKRYLLAQMEVEPPDWDNLRLALTDFQQRLDKASAQLDEFGSAMEQYDKPSSNLATELANVISLKRAHWVVNAGRAIDEHDTNKLRDVHDSGERAVAALSGANKKLAVLIRDLRK
jgi:hypothetical protein